MAQRTPRRGINRVGMGSGLPASVRRTLAAAVDSQLVYGDTVQPDTDGRLEVRVDPDGSLKTTTRGLALDIGVGEDNFPKMDPIDDLGLATNISNATNDQYLLRISSNIQIVEDKMDMVLKALRDSKRLRIILGK